MTYDLSTFDLGDMLKCSLRLRDIASGAPSLEASAQRVCRFLYDELHAPGIERACTLVRCYKTHPYGLLEPTLQLFARNLLGSEPPTPKMKCLTLMGTAGSNPSWNSRQLSRGHRAIPLASGEMVEKAPMISQLIKELGLETAHLLQPSPEIVNELAGKQHGVFHVEHALGSPYIPAQEEFVVKYGVQSVVGFGGMLATGDLFAVILFSTVHVPARPADRFRNLALDVKSAFSRFSDANVFIRSDTAGAENPQMHERSS
jgi:two-component system NtrC family sensor kinase